MSFRIITRDKLARLAGGDQEVIRFFENLAAASGAVVDGEYGDILVSGSGLVWNIGPGTVGLDEVDPSVLDRANHTGMQAIATVTGLQDALNDLQGADVVLQGEIDALVLALGGKQDTLVSGVNIKTINGNSLLGAGDLVISGGGGGLSGVATVTVAAETWTHIETVAAVGVIPANLIFLAIGAHADTDENSPELLDISAMSGTAGTDQITVTLNFATATSGPILINWSAM
jgi:hypothetical protein